MNETKLTKVALNPKLGWPFPSNGPKKAKKPSQKELLAAAPQAPF